MPRLPKSFKGNKKQGRKSYQQKSDDGSSKAVVATKEAYPAIPPPCDKCKGFHPGTTCFIPRGRICYACREPGHYVKDCPIRSMSEDKPNAEGKEITIIRKRKKEHRDGLPKNKKCLRCRFEHIYYLPHELGCVACPETGLFSRSGPSQSKPEESIVWERISPPKCEQCKELHFGTTCDVPPGLVCYACKRSGHYARDCPYPPKQKIVMIQRSIQIKKGRSS